MAQRRSEEPLPAAGPGEWGQWGLRFQSSSGDVDELEQAFLAARCAAHQATAAVLSAGVALVHALLAFKLYSQGQTALAVAAAATMLQQLLVWLLAVMSPRLFIRLRPLLYTFSVTFPAVQPSPLASSTLAAASCGSPAGPAFWVSQLLASGVPWLVVHAVLFPLTVNQGLLVHGFAVLLLLSGNRQRCTAALSQCPAAGPMLTRLAGRMQQLAIFSATPRSWLGGGGATAAGGGGDGGPFGSTELRACVATYGAVQIALGYFAVLQLAWWLERAARLSFLRRTEEVEAEWRLERKQRAPGTLALELAALLLLAWQAVDLWLSVAADWRLAGSGAGGVAGSPAAHTEL